MPLTLREAMTMVEPLRQSRILAGERGLDHVVQSVNVMEVPNILDWVRPGELLVTTMYPLRDDAAGVDTLVPQLSARGLAGLAVTPLRYVEQFPQAMIEAADALGFPLIELPPNVSFIDIIQPLTNEILKLQADELRESERIHRQFIDLVLGGGGYTEIAQGIAQRLHCSVSIVDRFRRLLGSSFLMGARPVYKPFIRDDGQGDVYLSEDYRPETVEDLSSSGARQVRLAGPEGGIDVIVFPVKVGASTLGEILVWSPSRLPLTGMELIAVGHGSTVAALKMMEMRSIGQVEERFQNEILEGLLSEKPLERARAIDLSRELGRRLEPPFAVLMIRPDLPTGTVLPKAETAEQSNIDSSMHLARRYIRLIEAEASFWYQGSRLVVFFPLRPDRLAGGKSLLTEELGAVCKRIERDNAPYTVSIGVSSPASELSSFHEAFDAAQKSLEIGRILRRPSEATVTHYEDLGLFRILPLAESPTSLERFCESAIGPLLEHDRAHGTALVQTLETYLAKDRNAAQTAKALFIHYNTLRYRLDRIRGLLGDALDDPRRRLGIELALQLYPLVSGAEAPQAAAGGDRRHTVNS